MANTWKNQPLKSEDITRQMRRVNALEAGVGTGWILQYTGLVEHRSDYYDSVLHIDGGYINIRISSTAYERFNVSDYHYYDTVSASWPGGWPTTKEEESGGKKYVSSCDVWPLGGWYILLKVYETTALTQTTFYGYTLSTKTSLGTPDAGVSVPNLNALNTLDNSTGPVVDHIIDLRTAIERLVATGHFGSYNWVNGDANNLYKNAVDQSLYGGGAQRYTWARDKAALLLDEPRDIDIGEVAECITLLENA